MNRTLLLLIALTVLPAQAQETDTATGLLMADGWQSVRENCTRCHSSQLIVQNSGSLSTWRSRLRWMQDTQGMPALDTATETTILQYLTDNYGQKNATRRPGLAAELLPPNPYPVAN